MPNKTITQVPVVASTEAVIRLIKTAGVWAIHYDYDVKDNLGNVIVHRVVLWVPGAAGQTKVQDLENSVCIAKSNQQEGT